MNKKLNIIIIDDSIKASKLLSLMIQELDPDVNILGCINNSMDALKFIKQHHPDAVFLDIEMPQKSGLVLAQEILENSIPTQIVFVTAYNQYAISAFRLSAIDYLLKPINELHLKDSIAKLRNNMELKSNLKRLETLVYNMNAGTHKTIALPVLNGYEYISTQDIEYIEADGSYAIVALINGKLLTISKNLKYFEESVSEQKNFVRIHRSFLINIHYVGTFSKSQRGFVIMKSGRKIKIARERKQLFHQVMENKKHS